MKSRIIGTLFVAAASGALIAGPMIGTASAAVPTLQQDWNHGWDNHDHDRDGDWGGFNRPGWADPNDPWRNDWHCDRHGNWHWDEHDHDGHHDDRCRAW
ncbi:hypothetical protein [Nocardia sp. NBC_00511]|uniref:hypothetical protein n=1 Tax=Nocardia sp. NBC_00511 TaxID=2903591 RepID=UPI0030E01839